MKTLTLFLIYISNTLKILHAEVPYTLIDRSYTNSGTVYEVDNLTPVKSQDGIGLCYGFSATTLLENFRCRELNLNCSNPHEILSSLDVTSYYGRNRLDEGGNPSVILNNIAASNRKIAREECAKFSTLVYQMNDSHNNPITDERRGWIFLTQKWNEYKGLDQKVKRNDCVSCLAQSIKSALVNIQTPADQIQKAFLDAHTLEEFIYMTVLPTQCLNDSKTAELPPFEAKSYPGYKDILTEESLTKKIESLLMSNIPLEMSICGDPRKPCPTDFGHSVAVVGLKEVCKGSGDCKKVVKLKNSYGMSWQQQNNDGWVDLQTLVESSLATAKNYNINWIQKPGYKLVEKSLKAESYYSKQVIKVQPKIINNSNTVPAEYKDYKGIWKCPGSAFMDHYESGCVPMK
jgi:hypothetical protein